MDKTGSGSQSCLPIPVYYCKLNRFNLVLHLSASVLEHVPCDKPTPRTFLFAPALSSSLVVMSSSARTAFTRGVWPACEEHRAQAVHI